MANEKSNSTADLLPAVEKIKMRKQELDEIVQKDTATEKLFLDCKNAAQSLAANLSFAIEFQPSAVEKFLGVTLITNPDGTYKRNESSVIAGKIDKDLKNEILDPNLKSTISDYRHGLLESCTKERDIRRGK